MNFSSNKIIKNLILTLIIFIVCFSIAIGLYFTEVQKRFQNSLYDVAINIKTKIPDKKRDKKTDEIVIVPISQEALDKFETQNIYWPWQRSYYAMFAYHIISQGAKAVVFDIIFTNPDIDRARTIEGGFVEIEYGFQNDNTFRNMIDRTGKIIIAYNVHDEDVKTAEDVNAIEIINAGKFKNIPEYVSITSPYQLFAENNKNLGFVNTKADLDGIIRKYVPFVKIKDKYYPSMAVTTYLFNKGKKIPENLSISKDGSFIINYYGQGGRKGIFKYVSIIDIMGDWSRIRKGKEPELPADTFKDKVVFVGGTALGLLDMKSTPFTKNEDYPGVEIHATSYLNLVNNDWIKPAPFILEIIIYSLILLILIFIGMDSKSPLKYFIIFFVLIIVIIGLHFVGYWQINMMFNTAFFVILFFFGFLGTQITNYLTVGRNRNRIKNAFSAYISPDLLGQVTKSDHPLTAEGEKLDGSAIFIDIAGFTTFSEKNPVEKVVEALNLYLQKFSEVILINKGWVNKYLGDGLMALFGPPTGIENHEEMAVKSAFECYAINKALEKDYGLNVRIGVNTGKMIFGSFGGGGKLEFTAIGDSINSSSRLEGANKFFTTNILIGEKTKLGVKGDYDLNYVGKFSLKGKDIPTAIYYFNEGSLEYKEKFNIMVEAWEKNDVKKFIELANYFKSTDFGPALYYINYYKKHKENIGKPIKFTEK